jgi:hypothetical protein
MSRGERQTVREGSQVKVTDLRERFRTASKPGKPAKPAKHAPKPHVRNHAANEPPAPKSGRPRSAEESDMLDARMEKAERVSQVQHTTSLLKSKPKNNRALEYKEKKKSGLVLQLVLVVAVAGAVTIALDPTILPREVRTLDWDGMKYQVELFLQNVTG